MDISLHFFAKKTVEQFQEYILSKRDAPHILTKYFAAFSKASVRPCFRYGLHMSDFPLLIIELCRLHKVEGNEEVINKGIQLLGNITVQNEEGKEKIWSLCFPDFFIDMLTTPFNLCESIGFLIFNCIDDLHVMQLILPPHGLNLVSRLLFQLTKDNCGDFCQLVLSRILLDYKGAVILYSLFSDNRNYTPLLLLLDFLFQSNEFHILSMRENSHVKTCTSMIELLIRDFLILKPTLFEAISLIFGGNVGEQELITKAELFKGVLAVLAVFSGFSELLVILHSNPVLLEECLTILDAMTAYSQPKLANTQLFPNTSKEISDQVSDFLYGIKQHIMQLIANLLYSNTKNINLIYENKSSLILILNHCRVDSLNPFLMQWAILAIRNLCQDQRVQLMIGEMEKLGLNSNDVMKQAGLTVITDTDGTIKLTQHR